MALSLLELALQMDKMVAIVAPLLEEKCFKDVKGKDGETVSDWVCLDISRLMLSRKALLSDLFG